MLPDFPDQAAEFGSHGARLPRFNIPPLPRAITVHDVTKIYGWSRSVTYQLLGEGKLRGVKVGKRLLILVDLCERLLAILPQAKIKPVQRPAA